jgi:type I restriction-modification system DNA methylase subunit
MWDKIRDKINDHAYMSSIDRDKQRIQSTAEIFTPTDLVIEMLNNIEIDRLGAGKTILDPACGDGQFLTAIKWVKVYIHQMTEEEALQDIYGVDIMRDNVDLCKKRLGGGTILMGDSLNPDNRLKDQTEDEYRKVISILLGTVDIEEFML